MMSASHDRVVAALELRQGDRVPTMDMMIEYGNINEILGRRMIPLEPFFKNRFSSRAIDLIGMHTPTTLPVDIAMDIFSYDRTDAAVKMGYDSAWVQHSPTWRRGDSRRMSDIFGRRFEMTFDRRGNIGTPMYIGGSIDAESDWQALDKRQMFGLPGKNLKAYSKIQRDFGRDIFIFGSFPGGLYELTWMGMGFERFVRATRKDRALLRRITGFYTDLFCLMLEAMAEAGLPGVVYSDDLAYRSGPMLNPVAYEELFGEGHRLITETAHRLGMKIIIHSCGNVYDLLEWFITSGFDGVHALEPTAGVELGKAKEMVGDRICLVGNVDITHILFDATREEVFEAIRLSIEDAAPGEATLSRQRTPIPTFPCRGCGGCSRL
jgi:hypothetical protein